MMRRRPRRIVPNLPASGAIAKLRPVPEESVQRKDAVAWYLRIPNGAVLRQHTAFAGDAGRDQFGDVPADVEAEVVVARRLPAHRRPAYVCSVQDVAEATASEHSDRGSVDRHGGPDIRRFVIADLLMLLKGESQGSACF